MQRAAKAEGEEREAKEAGATYVQMGLFWSYVRVTWSHTPGAVLEATISIEGSIPKQQRKRKEINKLLKALIKAAFCRGVLGTLKEYPVGHAAL